MPPSPKIPIAPGTRLDGITKPTRAKNQRKGYVPYGVPKPRCPHVKLGGGMCGLTPAHCRCLCMLCQAPMCAQQVCGVCTWGEPGDAPPAVSVASPEGSKMMGRMFFGSQAIGIRNLCLPNLEPGGPSYVGGVSLCVTPKRRERTPTKVKVKSPVFDPADLDITPTGSPAKLPPPTPYPRPAIPRAWLP